MRHLDPLTIGIQGPWGGGKSTILGLLETELADDAGYVVVRTNPWEYDDQLDVKGTLIAQVLQALEDRFGETAGIKEKIQGLLKRISWSRATLALAKGALTMQWDLNTLVDAFTPKAKEQPESMAGFRQAFGEMVGALPDVRRVVVLVDDLDRCLPHAVMATLEAIKLFLSVERMVFIIAADQAMVRDAIAASLATSPRGERFAQRYLDKIVQLPVSLPRLAPHEAEAYIGLLLSRSECDEEQFAALVDHCRARRKERRIPLLGNLGELPYRPGEELLLLAGQLTQGAARGDRRRGSGGGERRARRSRLMIRMTLWSYTTLTDVANGPSRSHQRREQAVARVLAPATNLGADAAMLVMSGVLVAFLR